MKPVRPDFDRPPLIEQAITAVFDRLDQFSIGDFGLFWSEIKDRFSVTEAQQPLDPRIEQFEGFRPERVTFRLLDANTLPRCFYRSEDGTEVLQVQPDRFTYNWQKGEEDYPHSEATMDRFRMLFAKFCEFVMDRGWGPLNITQCELVNLNIIPVEDFGETFADAAEAAFCIPRPSVPMENLPAESYILNNQHLIMHEGEPAGRLYVQLSPVLRTEDDQKAYRLELTARGAPFGGTDGTMPFFELARYAVNLGFLGATTERARKFWGEKHNG